MIIRSALPGNPPLCEVREHGLTDLRTGIAYSRRARAWTDDMKSMLERAYGYVTTTEWDDLERRVLGKIAHDWREANAK